MCTLYFRRGGPTDSYSQSAAGNWFADVIRYAYDDALCMNGGGGCDAVFICAGTLRGDTVYGPGECVRDRLLCNPSYHS